LVCFYRHRHLQAMSPVNYDWLQEIHTLCDQTKATLIQDIEIWQISEVAIFDTNTKTNETFNQ